MMRISLFIFSMCILQAGEVSTPITTNSVENEQRVLNEFVQTLSKAPAVHALRLRYAAAQRAEDGAGRLADPMIGLGYARLRMPMENHPIYEAMVEQSLPRWGERDASRALAVADSAMAAAGMQR